MPKGNPVTESMPCSIENKTRICKLRDVGESYNDVLSRLLLCYDHCGLVFDMEQIEKSGQFIPLEQIGKDPGLSTTIESPGSN